MKSAILVGIVLLACPLPIRAEPTAITIHGDRPGVPVSPWMYGIFFEDINYAADGGLYAEMVQNRSFEFYGPNHPPLMAWTPIERGLTVKPRTAITAPVHPHNPNYLVLTLSGNSGQGGIANTGYDGGMPLQAGARYDLSVHARHARGQAAPIVVALEDRDGQVLARTELPAPGKTWARYEAVLAPSRAADKGRLVLTTSAPGEIHLDMVSLFPQDTFKGRKNGLRKDLAQTIADLRPKTVRFPGGCIVHGTGLTNAYRWKDTVGDPAQRKPNPNLWGYHQSYGLGYFEYFQFCEDIGAEPLPILPIGISCGFRPPYQVATDEALQPWIQDMLDLVEFANGPAESRWGQVRAAMGHPAPFHLKLIGLGNEEHDTTSFRKTFPIFVESLRAKHPEIQIVGTSGLGTKVPLLDLMTRCQVEISDEHYYEPPEWFITNRRRFDDWPRQGPKIYVGEYASRGNTHFNALAEAVYLTGLERNADKVVMTAYAPLLARYKFTQWNQANLIHFNENRVVKTPNYHVQHLFSNHVGTRSLTTEVAFPPADSAAAEPVLGVSATLAEKDGKLFIKLANPTERPHETRIALPGLAGVKTQGELITLQGPRDAANTLEQPDRVAPTRQTLDVGPSFALTVPPFAVQVVIVPCAPR